MKLENLFDKIPYTLVKGNMDIEIKDIAYDSRNVKNDYLFVAISGSENDGHLYINDAIKNGAVAILVSEDISCNGEITVIKVKDTRSILSKLAI